MTSLSRRDTASLAVQWHDLGMDRSRKRSLHARPQINDLQRVDRQRIYAGLRLLKRLNNSSDQAQGAAIAGNEFSGVGGSETRPRSRSPHVTEPMMISFYPLEDRTTTHAAAIYYRDQAKTWGARAAAVPDGARNQGAIREIADGYEKIAAQYERREQRERDLKQVAVSEGV